MSGISLMRGNFYLDCNAKISNSNINTSRITSSSIDMNGAIISNTGTPTQPTDSVNKAYVDNALGITSSAIQIVLTGTSYSNIITSTSGSVIIVIKNIIANGPSATFNISKNSSSISANPLRLTSSAGIGTFEKLMVRWNAGGPLQVKKTGVNYDGVYNVVITYV